MKLKSTTSSLFGSKSKVKAKGGGRLQAVKSVTVPGKCSAISDGDRQVFPIKNEGEKICMIFHMPYMLSVLLQIKQESTCDIIQA
jgi:hypothetical protein